MYGVIVLYVDGFGKVKPRACCALGKQVRASLLLVTVLAQPLGRRANGQVGFAVKAPLVPRHQFAARGAFQRPENRCTSKQVGIYA